MNIQIEGGNPIPIYEQLINKIKENIINKEILQGEALPSIRVLAKELQISVITTKRAYEELEKEGLIYAQAGKGFYVCVQNTDVLREKKIAIMEKRMQELIGECKASGLDKEDIKGMVDIFWGEE